MLRRDSQRPSLRRSSRRLSRAILLVPVLVAGVAACGSDAPPASDGRGLVLLPDETPLARGVEKRDERLNFHDFGLVPDGDTVTHVFQLRNEDPRPVSVTRVDPGCGCTVASLRAVRADGTIEKGAPATSKAEKLLTVAPGELVEIEVRVATRDLSVKNNDKLITLRVLTDSPNGYFITLEVHIFAEQPFTVVPATLALGDVPENGGGEGKVEIVGASYHRHRVSVKELLPPPEGVRAELSVETRNFVQVWTLHAELPPPLARGPYSATLRLATEDSEGLPGREIEVPLTAVVVGDLTAQPERLVFAATRDASARGSTEFYSRLAGHRLRVTDVELPEAHSSFLSARFEALEPDNGGSSLRWRVTLETKPPLPPEGMVTGTLVLRLDDPTYPSYELDYVVHVR